jgi:LysM repeat protein
MGAILGPATVRSLTSAILALAALVVVGSVAFAAPADFSERDLSPPQRARSGAKAHAPARRPQPLYSTAAATAETSTAQQETQDSDEDTPEQAAGEEGVPAASVASAAQNTPSSSGGDLSYVIRQGDSVGAISAMFHMPAEEIFRHNRLNEASTLHVGQVLRIPNPYAAQVRDLQRQIASLTALKDKQQQQLQTNGSRERAAAARIEELRGLNRSLEHDVTMLPWWRRATTVAATLALVMLGVALLSLVQWFLVRWRFVAVAQANEKFSKLDHRYRIMLARAELRLQQLYGRRRAAAESATAARPPEDFDLERLSREVKEVLERELEQLGVQPQVTARRSRFREWLTSGSSPVAVRSDRR